MDETMHYIKLRSSACIIDNIVLASSSPTRVADRPQKTTDRFVPRLSTSTNFTKIHPQPFW